MKKIYLFTSLLFLYFTAAGQNLVPNGDFETYSTCPTVDGQISRATPWFEPTGLNQGSDYFNVCSPSGAVSVPAHSLGNGYQYPHSGNGYAGMYLYHSTLFNLRESIEVQTISPLVAGQCYNFSMYINLFNRCRYTTNAIGVYFSDTAFHSVPYPGLINVTPQIINAAGNLPDTLSWLLVTGTYTAVGGENYMLISNFFADSSTALITINSTAGQYIYCYVDDVSLIPCSASGVEELSVDDVIIYPSPVIDVITIKLSNNTAWQLKITDVTGNTIYTAQVKQQHTYSTNIGQLPKGIYFLEVLQNGKHFVRKVVKM